MRVKTSTTKLPVTLREELDAGASNGRKSSAGNDDPNHYRIARHNTRGGNTKMNRKDARKQDREAKKHKKAEFFAHGKKRPAEEELPSPQAKKQRQSNGAQVIEKEKAAPEVKKADVASQPAKSKAQDKPKKVEKPVKSVPLPLSRVEEDEERYIRQLEKQLGYGKGSKGKKSNPEEDDGLDDLLNWADNFNLSTSKSMVAESDEDMPFDEEEDAGSETYSEEFNDGSDFDEDESGDEESGDEEGEEWGGIADSGDDETPALAPAAAPSKGAYIPPHLRKAKLDGQQPSEEILKLTRQLKGLLNRMSEANMASIIDGVEEIYRNNSRNDVTSTLAKLIIDGISSHSMLLDSYVVLHGAFVSSLHKLIGVEFAAHFVQETITLYEKHYSELSTLGVNDAEPDAKDRGKECSNLIVLISELYNFQVISCVLVFDIIRSLLDGRLSEFDVELLLKVLRSSGQQLRQDDPLALKDIVQAVQDKVADEKADNNSRIRFMIETLLNLKNNKVKKVSAAQSQGGDSVERMKKFLAGLSKNRTVLSHEPLRVSLQDLHSADTKGKWWLVGAAWGGDPLVERRAELEKRMSYQQQALKEESNLVKLARKQGMNSDIRRSTFVVLMSSEDYVDCCERLSQLNLTEVQQREIVRVLLHCCGNEKSYNPYYALIAQHLCKQSHSYKITIQFCLWDFLRDLGETKVGGAELLKSNKDDDGFDVKSISRTRMRNVAKCYAWWIARDAVSLLVLKPVDFTVLKPQSKEFLRELISQILFASQLTSPLLTDDLSTVSLTKNRTPIEEIFIKASKVDTLAMGLAYFLAEEFRSLRKEEDSVSKFLSWGVALATETLRSGLDFVQAL
ncbi:MIF4G/MA4 domain-containing protein [Ephemerocybe angulata]|uniref:MIF4G/MA4 domain-containing protein n=1 Tax=Ephemerocybe angulata TaxID=980116 RepID=A0A8H6HXM8_9AGAR|nr:MIF4G/MA4 domain-containing protein [Tulosesus angulatus]